MSFSFADGVRIRVVMIDGQPWFVANDVVGALGLDTSRGAGPHLQRLRADERRVIWKRDYLNLFGESRAPSYAVISESGLYKLIMRSDAERAQPFQDWVTRDVLPAIRRDGAYVRGEERVTSGDLNEDAFVLHAMKILQSKVDRLASENTRLEAENVNMSAELNRLTVNEFVALRHEYMGRQRRVLLGTRAAEICRVRKLPLEKQERTLRSRTGDRTVTVNVYDRGTLEEAYALVFSDQ